MSLDLEPLKTFFSEDTNPKAFAKLLDEFMYDYTTMLVKVQLSDCIDKTIHQDTEVFLAHIKLLRDILPLCEK